VAGHRGLPEHAGRRLGASWKEQSQCDRSASWRDRLPAIATMAERGMLRGYRLRPALSCGLRAGRRRSRPQPIIRTAETLRSTPESGARAAYDGCQTQGKLGSDLAVDHDLGHMWASARYARQTRGLIARGRPDRSKLFRPRRRPASRGLSAIRANRRKPARGR